MPENDNHRYLPQLTSILKAVQRIFTIRISAKKRSVGEREGAGSMIQVNLKVVPTIIPAVPTIIPAAPTIVPAVPTVIPAAPTIVPAAPTIVPAALTIIPAAPTIIPANTIVKLHPFPSGTGGLGDVWKCSMSTLSGTRQVAVKTIRIPQGSDQKFVAKASRSLRREACVWIKLKHLNILPLLREVAAGLQYLHDNGIVHGDLNPTKVLVSGDGRLCLGNFSFSMDIFSMNVAEPKATTGNSCHVGNVRWMAPEILAIPDEGTSPRPTEATDVYSYGCIMIYLLSGHRPYSRLAQGMHVILARVRGVEPFSQPQIEGVPEDVREFAGRCLSTSGEDRPRIFEIVQFLWSRIDITETITTWLSKLTVKQIPQAVLKKGGDGDDLGVLGAPLKCTWSSGSSEIKGNDINKACNTIRREIYIREKLRNENILALYGMTTGFGVLPSFVHPWMSGGSLHDFVKREPKLSGPKKFDILYQVADGIKYLHNEGIVHGNLTGDNVLLDGLGSIRITDFSRSVILLEADDQVFSERIPGDVRYIAPECIVPGSLTGPQNPTKAQDMYSYGCVAVLVLSGKAPYWWIAEESTVLSERIKDAKPLNSTMEIDEVHLNLVRQCLSEEKSRPSIEKVIYSALVQHFGAVDLTNAVERLNNNPQACGGFSDVHKCRLQPINIDEGIRRAVLYDQFTSVSTCVEVAVKAIRLSNSTDMLKTINLVDVAHGLQYLHSQHIIHGDLSGNNVLIDRNGKASLVDFGLSALLPGRMSQALLPTNPGGTAQWMAPEHLILDGEGNVSLVFSQKSDSYSFGGIMLQVLEGKVPYHYIACSNIMFYLMKGVTPNRPSAPVIVDSDWDFIQTCWSKDMECRPSDAEILAFVKQRAERS
ncbi:hypothetical protein AZE42_01526 [Rhizopogon vesiculosus]|uniref:Protein kinase domain-containing protein n=1 Tax=Rhizopogon vesiculosus TaxID=180088 RepID=A0A1J8QJZ5_9AGAM|nr:hypothetical protein AZE42_01526 [Rhizopogon vesiculosus]